MDISHENKLIQDFSTGSENAFKWLYDEYFTLMRYYAFRYLNDPHEVDDVVQIVFIKVWEKKEIFHSLPALRAYIFRSVRNQCFNRIRHLNTKYQKQEILKEVEAEESIFEKLIKLEVFDQLMITFKKLPPAARNVYWLSLNGMSHKEISEKLNISVNTIKTHKSRANAFLKSELKNLFTLLLGII